MSHLVDRRFVAAGTGVAIDADGFSLETSNFVMGDSLRTQRCLVILGEPGIGKSTIIAGPSLMPAGVEELRIDLGGIERMTDVFDHPMILTWKVGEGELCLVLDALDEAIARLGNAGRILGVQLRQLPTDRLWLRITCRSADWPSMLDQDLGVCFSSENTSDRIPKWELTPLSEADVAAYASAHALDGQKFLDAVLQAYAGPLAARPLTLKFLVDLYRDNAKNLVASMTELYESGLEHLAREWNQSRLDTQLTGRLTAIQRLAIARRIAACALLAGTDAIVDGIATPGQLSMDTLIGGNESILLGDIEVSKQNVQEVLATSIFASSGDHSHRFSHRTFMEYLCATFLTPLTDRQLRSILLGFDGLVYPMLRQVAAWITAIDPPRFLWIAEVDPELFLSVPIAVPDDDIKRVIVDGILARAALGESLRSWQSSARMLRHSDLETQLRPWLAPTQNEDARCAAIRIIRDTRLLELREDLVTIVLDASAPLSVRVDAGSTLCHFADAVASTELASLATRSKGDLSIEIKRIALQLSWPRALSTSDLFSHLVAPLGLYIDSYSRFLYDLPTQLSGHDLVLALEWVLETEPVDLEHYPLNDLADSIVRQAMRHPDEEPLLTALTKIAIGRMTQRRGLFFNRPELDKNTVPMEVRCRLQEMILPLVSPDHVLRLRSTGASDGLFDPSDLEQLVEWFDDPKFAVARPTIGRLIKYLYNPVHTGHVDLIMRLSADHPIRSQHLIYWLETIHLGSVDAARQKAEWLSDQSLIGVYETRPNDQMLKAITSLLDVAESINQNAFWLVCRKLQAQPDSKWVFNRHYPDLINQHQWRELPRRLKARIVAAALAYLKYETCAPPRWLGTNYLPYQSIASFQAMALLLYTDLPSLNTLDASVWEKWASTVVAYPTRDRAAKKSLLELASVHAHASVIEAVGVLMKAANDENEEISLDEVLNVVWCDELAHWLLARVQSHELAERTAASAESILAERQPELVRRWLETRLDDCHVAFNTRAQVGGLLLGMGYASWNQVFNIIRSEESLGKAMIETAAMKTAKMADVDSIICETERITHDFSVNAKADLFLWLATHYTYESDLEIDTSDLEIDAIKAVLARECVMQLRNNVLKSIEQEGSADAVEQCDRIVVALPMYHWLRRVSHATRETTRSMSWEPLPPKQLIKLRNNNSEHLVRTERDLRDAVLEVFETIQHRLICETPESHLLWNTDARNPQSPKTEDEISDYLRNELKKQMGGLQVVINREVQVRRLRPSGLPERTDLRIDAVVPGDSADYISVPVEVKGAWNNDLLTALGNQLVSRYMRDLSAAFGIYVVVWPDLDSWNNHEGRRDNVGRLNRAEVDKKLYQQVNEASRRGYHVVVVNLDISYCRPILE